MAGIKDIAREAGVSISTVSYALNNSPKVTEATRSRIRAISEEMGYVPNAAARMLKVKETKIIGAFLDDHSGAFYGMLIKGMRDTLKEKGYELIVCSGQRSHRLLLERIIDGGIILEHAFSNKELLDYADKNYKMIVLDRKLQHPNIRGILLDNKEGAKLAIEELLKNKAKKMFVVTGPRISHDSNERIKGVREAMKDHPEIEYIELRGEFTKESGEKAAREIFANYTEPVAIFCLNDEMAIGVYNYLKETEYTIGKHVYIVGFDNIELSHYVEPILTTVSYSTYDWGALAAKNLLKLISNKSVENEKIQVALRMGESS